MSTMPAPLKIPASRGATKLRAANPSQAGDLRAQIRQSAHHLMDFLTDNRSTSAFAFPFSSSYPRNCCESVAMIFSYLLEEKYRLADVAIIRGTKPRLHEHHFWVRVDGSLYDLTAHQFPNRRPILGVERHTFFAGFPEQRVLHEPDFVDREEVLTLYRAGVIPF